MKAVRELFIPTRKVLSIELSVMTDVLSRCAVLYSSR